MCLVRACDFRRQEGRSETRSQLLTADERTECPAYLFRAWGMAGRLLLVHVLFANFFSAYLCEREGERDRERGESRSSG